jgi:hypothetical protein
VACLFFIDSREKSYKLQAKYWQRFSDNTYMSSYGVCMDSTATCMHGVASNGQLDGVNVPAESFFKFQIMQ